MRRPGAGLCLLACLWLGCEADPSAPFPRVDQAPPLFNDARPPRDGLVIIEDVGLPTRDAVVRTEAGICETGDLIGLACAPGGQGLAGAQVVAVTEDCFGNARQVTVTADVRGRFRLANLAPGPIEISVRLGSFFGRYLAEVLPNQARPINGDSEKACLPADSTRLGVLTGDFDQIQAILAGLGFDHDVICGDRYNHRPARQLLADPAALAAYDILFVNCTSGIDLGHTDAEVQQAIANLRAFVAGGGSLYVSDLSADFVRRAWPDKVTFLASQSPALPGAPCCVCTDCGPECRQSPPAAPRICDGCCPAPRELPADCGGQNGTGGRGPRGSVTGVIHSPLLARFLGTEVLNINFNLSGWVEIAEVAADVEVLVADAAGRPLMVVFEPSPGGGRVAYTSFHNHAQATGAMLRILEALVFRL